MSREKPFLNEDQIIRHEAFESWLAHQTLFDDSFFTVFFHNKSVATSMVRTLLESEEVRLAHSATQVEFRNPGFKTCRFDMLAQTSDGQLVVTEVQKALAEGPPERWRFYSSILDTRMPLKAGDEYSGLPETWLFVIFPTDPIGDGQFIYRFERRERFSHRPMGDRSHIVYINAAKATAETQLGRMVLSMRCDKADDMVYNEFVDWMRDLKTGNVAKEYEKMLINEFDPMWDGVRDRVEAIGERRGEQRGIAIGEHRGIAIGEQRATKKEQDRIARSLLMDGHPRAYVSRLTTLSAEEVDEIARSLGRGN